MARLLSTLTERVTAVTMVVKPAWVGGLAIGWAELHYMTPRLRAIVVLTIDCSVPEEAGGVRYCAVRTRPLAPLSTASAGGLDDHKVLIEQRGDTMPKVVRVQAAGGPRSSRSRNSLCRNRARESCA